MMQLFVRDPDLVLIDEIDDFTKLTAIPRWSDVGAASLDIAYTAVATTLTEPGFGLVLTEDEQVVFSGITTQPDRRFAAQANGFLLSFVSDEVVLADRLAYPGVPVLQGDGTYKIATAYDIRDGIAETIMHQFVLANAGPTNVSYPWTRPISVLTFAPDLGRGPSVTAKARFVQLLELLQQIGIVSGIGFEVKNMRFSGIEPEDLTAEIVFSTDIGNLSEAKYSFTRPTATHVVVGGGGDGTARTFHIGGDAAASTRWGWKIEKFRDARSTTDPDELQVAYDEEIAKNAEKAAFSLTPLDIPGYSFGSDYKLGDTVTGEIDGQTIEGSIKQVTITLDANGTSVTPDFSSATGAQAAFSIRTFDALREQERRLAALERSL